MGNFEVVMRGGLGNQLFIFSAAAYVSNKTGNVPVFDFLHARAGVANHGNSLEWLLSELGYSIKRRPKNLLVAKLNVVGKGRWEAVRSNLGHPRRTYLNENPGWVGDLTNGIETSAPLSGYFQSHRYASEAEPQLSDLWAAIQKRAIIGMQYKQEFESRNIAGIHIRRGDYLGTAKNLGAVDFSKLFKTTSLLQNFQRKIIFSDDRSFAEQFSSELDCASPVPQELEEASDLDQLVALSGACGLVISNSSFGWWAAYFSKATHIYAPEPWFRESESPREILPPSWFSYKPSWLD
jgi:hypothetical protein